MLNLNNIGSQIYLINNIFTSCVLDYHNANLAANHLLSDTALAFYDEETIIAKTSLLTEAPVTIINPSNYAEINGNAFELCSGTKGALDITLNHPSNATVFIASNTFARSSGYYKASAVHLAGYLPSYA